MINETNVVIFALIGGVIPALFWLWFWLREDRLNPEPKAALFSSFGGGIIAVLISLFLELIFYYLFIDANPDNIKDLPNIILKPLSDLAVNSNIINIQTNFWEQAQNVFNNLNFSTIDNVDVKRFFLIVIMAPIIEEILKLILTYNICLRKKVNDEPIDASIYMLTTALGFAAIETALFLTKPLTEGNVLDVIIAGNFRSIGPMLIHLVCSALLGIFIGLAFYKSKIKKFLYLILGLFLAIILHAIFNLFILLNDSAHNINFFWAACLGTWMLVVVLLMLFERVKKVAMKN